jgi:hypothetical protein
MIVKQTDSRASRERENKTSDDRTFKKIKNIFKIKK